MPSKKPDGGKKGNGDKKKGKSKDIRHLRTNAGVPARLPAVPDARGSVRPDGRFRCGIINRGKPCWALMKNEKHNIISHLSSSHKKGSAYLRNQDKSVSWPCAYNCPGRYANFNSLVAHVRRLHGFRGSSNRLKSASEDLGVTSLVRAGDNNNADVGDDDDDEDDDEDDDDSQGESDESYVPPPDRPDRDPGHEDQGPPGAGGGSLIPATA